MKNCKSINLLFGEVFSRELKGEQLQDFNNHLDNCINCNSQYNEFKTTLSFMNKRERPEMKDEFWDNYWDNLSEKARPSTSILFMDHRKFVFPTAALVLIIFGLFLGKMIFSPEGSQSILRKNELISKSPNANTGYYTMVNNHIDDLKPIFAEYSNYQVSDGDEGEFMSIRKELLKKLILQNYLLKRVADEKNDPQLTSLIEDFQLILLEIINSSFTGNEKINSVKSMLDGNDVIFKMNMLKKKNRFQKKTPGETI